MHQFEVHEAFNDESTTHIITISGFKIPEIGFPPSEKDLSEGLFLDPLLSRPLSDTIGSPLHLIACEGP